MTDFLAIAEFIRAQYTLLSSTHSSLDVAYRATPLAGRPGAYIALGKAGDVAVLLPVEDAGSQSSLERLDAITVAFNQGFLVRSEESGPAIESRFAAVILHEDRVNLLTAFANLTAVLLQSLPQQVSSSQLRTFLGDFGELFVPTRTISRDEVKGLWGELWLLGQVPHPDAWIAGWHMQAEDIFDFSLPGAHIEVKTTESEVRKHHFSLRQLQQNGKPAWIASIRVQADAGGDSIADLMSAVAGRTGSEFQRTLTTKCLRVVAGDLESLDDYKFLPSHGDPSRLIRAEDIPRVLVPPKAMISAVKFDVVVDDIEFVSPTADQLDALSEPTKGMFQ